MTETDVQKFYKNATVFLTGGTGFLGKILIEKLLRSTDVKLLYILIRDKKGKDIHSRIDELFDDVIFDRLKVECPKFRHKIEAIPGDCSCGGLGLNLIDRQRIVATTNVVFHVAATVRFDENLKLAYSINVNATKEMLDLARQMKELKAIMHVSTAYSHCHLEEVEEKFYDHPINYEEVGILLEKLTKNEAEDLTPRILGKWPNTYTFTKALAESLIRETGSGLPIGVFRPAIVLSTYKEPIPGWVDNMYGPTGVCAGCASGLLRVTIIDSGKTADLVPVDTCVAGLIASAWDVGTKTIERTSENIPIYNYVSSPESPLLWGEYQAINVYHGTRFPLSNFFWSTNITTTTDKRVYNFLTILYHILPALFFDTLALVTGHKPRLLKMYKKIHKLISVINYFCVREWKFSNDNVQKLYLKLSPEDRKLFPVSMENVNWMMFFKNYFLGMRRYLLKDPDSTIQTAKIKLERIQWIDTVLITILKSCLVILGYYFFSKLVY